MQAIKSELLALLRRKDLLRSALLLGKIQDPNFDIEAQADRVLELAAQAWHSASRARNDVILMAQAINSVLFDDYGIQAKGDKYKQVIDDPNRFYLHTVLDKKVASPLSMSSPSP
jgi:hypothetical protein